MRVAIVHLSDLHQKVGEGSLLPRAEKAAEAIRSSLDGAEACVVALTGDIACSGVEEEYVTVVDFLAAVQSQVTKELTGEKRFHFVAIPGNHDVDFESTGEMRALLMAAMASESIPLREATIATFTAPQAKFFEFRDAVCAGVTYGDGRAYFEYDLQFGESVVIRFRGCNTAMTSHLHEKPGALHFPWDLVRNDAPAATVDIAMMHHPYNWLTPDASRRLRRRIEEVSDIVLTGHDHEFDARNNSGWHGERNLYIEGGALQPYSAVDESTFNVVLLDLEDKRQRVTRFDWDGTMYRATGRDWEPYTLNQLRLAGEMKPNAGFQEHLDDTGIVIDHPTRGTLRMSDVFVYPELREVLPPNSRVNPPVLKGERLLELAAERGSIYVSGSEKSGRTCLAKRLFIDGLHAGFVPVLLDGGDLDVRRVDDVPDLVVRTFAGQYSPDAVDAYKQTERARRLLLVDDCHDARGVKGSLHLLLQGLSRFAGQVVLIGSGLSRNVRSLLEPDSLLPGQTRCREYGILPYGHSLRNQLVEKWCALDINLASDAELLAARVVAQKAFLDTALGKNLMPKFPLFILVLLQAREHGEAVNLGASTYGYFYELLIRRALARRSSQESFDVKMNYLSHLAYEMFKSRTETLNDAQMRRVHAEFEEQKLISVSFLKVHTELSQADILHNDECNYWFAYPYIYYYFVASYIRDRIDEEPVREIVRLLADNLQHEQPANIMLFLAHLSRSSCIIDNLLRVARTRFAENERASLSKDDPSIPSPEFDSHAKVFDDLGAGEGRALAMRRRDEVEEGVDEEVEGDDEDIARKQRIAAEFGVAFKTLQILGQVVKNFPGSLDGTIKKEIVNECYGVGLRTLGGFYSLVKAEEQHFMQSIVNSIQESDARIDLEAAGERAVAALNALVFGASVGTIRRIAQAVGSPELTRIYEVIEESCGTPAVALVGTALRLDHGGKFDESTVIGHYKAMTGNGIAQAVIRTLAILRFHLVDVHYSTKQRVCGALDINYRRLVAAPKAR